MTALQPTLTLQSPAGRSSDKEKAIERSPLVDRANNLLEQAWRRGWSSKPSLDPGAILASGQRGCARVEFADSPDWADRLDDLTTALHSEARLNPLGQTIAHGQLVRMVRQRMKLEALWQQRPEILDVPVAPPIIVLGQMRSGTTRMQRMLASDPRFSATRFCDGWFPLKPRFFDWRPIKAWATLRAIDIVNPRFRSIHPTSPCAVDEEIGWLGVGLSSTPFDAQWRVPSFVAANESRNALPVYSLLKRIIQTDQWQRGGGSRPRVLKVPQFMDDLDALLRVFPEACILKVQRDPVAVVASSCSLVANQRAIQSDDVNLAAIGKEWLQRTANREAKVRNRLARHAYPIVEIDFKRMDDDWRGAIREIYRALGMRCPDEVLENMQPWTSPKPNSGKHRYRLADFGLTAANVYEGLSGEEAKAPSSLSQVSRQFLPA